jgi:hypothetical protein
VGQALASVVACLWVIGTFLEVRIRAYFLAISRFLGLGAWQELMPSRGWAASLRMTARTNNATTSSGKDKQ